MSKSDPQQMSPRDRFVVAYRRVLAGTKGQLDERHFAECWRIAERFDPASFEPAASRLCEKSEFPPTAAEWAKTLDRVIEDWDRARNARVKASADFAAGERTYHCAVCQDTGFAYHDCPDIGGNSCGICKRHGQHLYDHRYVMPCGCRESNPIYQGKQARQREIHAKGRGNGKHEQAA